MANTPCTKTCGDGLIAVSSSEVCDDQNTVNNDGCSSACLVEHGFSCSGEKSICTSTCGDGLKSVAEICDDHNFANNDGCSLTCTLETNGYCNTGVEPNLCDICGNSK